MGVVGQLVEGSGKEYDVIHSLMVINHGVDQIVYGLQLDCLVAQQHQSYLCCEVVPTLAFVRIVLL
jgi:hypothetical protein